MNFTKKQIEILNKIRDEKEKIIVKGINAHGESFLTSCYIDTDPYRQVLSCFLPVRYGHSNLKTNFATDHHSMTTYSNAFTIEEIHTNAGELIYSNRDIEKYKNQAQATKEEFNTLFEKNGLLVTQDDAVTKYLRQLIGKPVILSEADLQHSNLRTKNNKPIKIKSKHGVLLMIGNSTYGGSVMICLSNGNTSDFAYVGPKTKLYSVNLDGTVKLVAENNIHPETPKIFESRVNKAKNALSSSFEINQVSNRKTELLFESEAESDNE